MATTTTTIRTEHLGKLTARKVREGLWEIPRQGRMHVPGRVYATDELFEAIRADQSIEQVVNVARLPGIVGYSLAMPDIHWGYGFPIGGVAAFDLEEGVVSPGGVGYDINCGVRLMAADLERKAIDDDTLERLVNALYRRIPSGVGEDGPVRATRREMRQVLLDGARWSVAQGFGREEDLAFIEEGGTMLEADPGAVSEKAKERGRTQLGTIGSGNHFVEVGYVDEIYEDDIAGKLGLELGMVTVIIHTGSRGCGHQICTDTVKSLQRADKAYGFELPDRQLAAAPIRSPEGQRYLGAMRCGVNFAFANREIVAHNVRLAFDETIGASGPGTGLRTVYEVAHNIAKIETHKVNGKERKVCVHRKGATRAFGPGHPDIPEAYRETGQPVLIPGDMGRYSFVLVGTGRALEETWGSTCHGAGRQKSRTQAKRDARQRRIFDELREHGVLVRAASKRTVAEEMPDAYKDVKDVVEAVQTAGLSKMVCRLRPIGCIKG